MTIETPNENHYVHRSNWLRAAVLGANDGLISTASLIVGIAATGASSGQIFIAGVAGLAAGAMAMAAGEYVSVSSQSDIERADILRERLQHEENPEAELKHLAEIYEERGLSKVTAMIVAKELTAHDAIGTHARDELGISDISIARPMQAAIASALAFMFGALLPLLAILILPHERLMLAVPIVTCFSLILLGYVSAKAGGAKPLYPIMRITFWGLSAMAITAIVGNLFEGSIL